MPRSMGMTGAVAHKVVGLDGEGVRAWDRGDRAEDGERNQRDEIYEHCEGGEWKRSERVLRTRKTMWREVTREGKLVLRFLQALAQDRRLPRAEHGIVAMTLGPHSAVLACLYYKGWP